MPGGAQHREGHRAHPAHKRVDRLLQRQRPRHEGADQLIDGLRIEADPTTRADLLEQLHRLVDEEQPVALLVHPLVAILFNRHIEGAEPGPLGLWPERFWVAPEHQRGAR